MFDAETSPVSTSYKVPKRRPILPSPPLKQTNGQDNVEHPHGENKRKPTSKRAKSCSPLHLFGIAVCLIEGLQVILYLASFMEANETTADMYRKPDDFNIDPRHDKERILQILSDAGIDNVNDETLRKLPTWTKVTSLYGEHPRIYGLEQCKVFQQGSGDPGDHFVGIAGTFNTGTNLLSELLNANCHLPARIKKYGPEANGMRWSVPWGKHNPPLSEKFRLTHQTQTSKGYNAKYVLSVVTIRDPYSWMKSMCRFPYSTHWLHTQQHCPNLVPNVHDTTSFSSLADKNSVPVMVRYSKSFQTWHDSLAHLWNDWYNVYAKADFPRIMVRFEDLIFFAKETTEQICKCAGGEMNAHEFHYIVASAKGDEGVHGTLSERTTLVDALIRYGTDADRAIGFDKQDIEFAKNNLNRELMEIFGYYDPPASP